MCAKGRERRGFHLVKPGTVVQPPLSPGAIKIQEALDRFGLTTEDMRRAYLVLLVLDCLPDGAAEQFLFGGLRELEGKTGRTHHGALRSSDTQ